MQLECLLETHYEAENKKQVFYTVKSDLIKKYINDIERETQINQNLLSGMVGVTKFYG